MRLLSVIATVGMCLAPAVSFAQHDIALTFLGRFAHEKVNPTDESAAEIAAYDPATRRLFCTNNPKARIDVLDITDPSNPVLNFSIPVFGPPNSVAVRDGVVAVAVQDAIKTNPGKVKFYTTGGTFLSEVTVGALPDMLTFTPNGRRVLVANEGEPSGYGLGFIDPPGSVSIIDMTGGAASLTNANVTTATFNAQIPVTNAESFRIFGPGATVVNDLEPEYIAVSHDSKTAWVTLQENNGLAVLDIEAGVFRQLIGLGFKNHNLAGNRLDASDRDNTGTADPNDGLINIANWPVLGMYQPDGIDTFHVNGKTYLVMANEGDARDWPGLSEEIRVGSGSYPLDLTLFPNAVDLKKPEQIGRLNVTRSSGKLDADDDYDQILAFGARSFSIREVSGDIVFDSGEQFEQITKAEAAAIFNSNGTVSTFDSRSDNKGPEPEGVTIGKAFGRTYAFIALERTGGVMVYDVSDPAAPTFVQYINTAPTDLGPEGILFIKGEDSPTGRPLVVTSNEISGTTVIFGVGKTK